MPDKFRTKKLNKLGLKKCLVALFALYCITHVLLALTPSSYALALQIAGQEVKGLIL